MGVVRQARESNMELLRIVSMLMVLLLHANFLVFGTPTAADATCQPVATFLRLFFESVSIVGVNLFVFISGWYGIKAKVSRIAAFLFQVFFFVAVCYGAEVVVLGTNTFSFSYLFHLLRMDSYWFAQAYLILYVLSPALNKFIEHSPHRDHLLLLISLFVVQTVFGWLGDGWYRGDGDSPLTFLFVYLLAAYVRRCSLLQSFSSGRLLFMAFGVILVGSLLAFGISVFDHRLVSLFYKHTSPLVLLEVSLIGVAFSKFHFRSQAINFVAASCFAVYLLNCYPASLDYYIHTVREWFGREPAGYFVIYVSVFVLANFLLALLIDQPRIAIWNFIQKQLDYKRQSK